MGGESSGGDTPTAHALTQSFVQSYTHMCLPVVCCTGTFELVVLGKNGVTVEGEPILPGMPPVPLISGTFITICDTSFWFLLPRRGTTGGAESKKRSR